MPALQAQRNVTQGCLSPTITTKAILRFMNYIPILVLRSNGPDDPGRERDKGMAVR